MEDHDFIHPIQEFRSEMYAQFAGDLIFHGFIGGASLLRFENMLTPDIRRHDENGIFEVHRTTLRIGQSAVVEYLQENVEDIVVRLFDFIEEDDRERVPPHRFRELPAFFIAHVAGRGADQSRNRMLLHIFRHVDTNEIGLVVEQRRREGAR